MQLQAAIWVSGQSASMELLEQLQQKHNAKSQQTRQSKAPRQAERVMKQQPQGG
jgi:hypothetical protein